MIAAFIAVLLINIGLWIVFVIRYKKRFSSEKYLSEVRTELNNLTADINRTTERNIQLIQAAVNRSKALSREIDVKLDMLDKKLALINSDIETKQNAPQLLNTVNFSELKENINKEVKTSVLNNVIAEAYGLNPAPSYKGKRLKITFIEQTGTVPPKFTFFVNNNKIYERLFLRGLESIGK